MNIYRLFLGLLFCFLTLSSWATSLGPQKTAVFLLDHQHFLNDPTSRPKKDQIYEALFQSPYSLAAFYKESSYDRLQITGNVFGWFQVDATQCLLNEKELVKLTKNAIDWTDWDRIIVLSYLDPTLCPDVGLGHSTFGKIQVSTPNGTAHVSLSFALLNNRFVLPQLPFQTLSGITSSVVAHEYGHALGIYGHANLYDCGRHTVSPDWKECHQEAIADRFSIMGGEGVYRVGLHHNACHKEQLGWFQNSQLLDVAPKAHPQVFRIYPYSSQDKDRIVAIKIALYQPIPIVPEKNVKLSVLHLTNRTAEGFDRRIEDLSDPQKYFRQIALHPRSGRSSYMIDPLGLQIRGGFLKNNRCVTTYLLDTHPNSFGSVYQKKFYDYSLFDALDGILNFQETFIEPYNGIQIKVLRILPDKSIEVEIKRV